MDPNSSLRALSPPDIALAKTGLQQTYQKQGSDKSLKERKTYVVDTASIMLKPSEPGGGGVFRKRFLTGVTGVSSNSLEDNKIVRIYKE